VHHLAAGVLNGVPCRSGSAGRRTNLRLGLQGLDLLLEVLDVVEVVVVLSPERIDEIPLAEGEAAQLLERQPVDLGWAAQDATGFRVAVLVISHQRSPWCGDGRRRAPRRRSGALGRRHLSVLSRWSPAPRGTCSR